MLKRTSLAVVVTAAIFAGPAAGSAAADFVCPVLPVSDAAKEHSNAGFITIGDGDTSILPGKAGDPESSPVDVPDRATNSDGAGSPAGDHAKPGDAGYSAIWNTD